MSEQLECLLLGDAGCLWWGGERDRLFICLVGTTSGTLPFSMHVRSSLNWSNTLSWDNHCMINSFTLTWCSSSDVIVNTEPRTVMKMKWIQNQTQKSSFFQFHAKYFWRSWGRIRCRISVYILNKLISLLAELSLIIKVKPKLDGNIWSKVSRTFPFQLNYLYIRNYCYHAIISCVQGPKIKL